MCIQRHNYSGRGSLTTALIGSIETERKRDAKAVGEKRAM